MNKKLILLLLAPTIIILIIVIKYLNHKTGIMICTYENKNDVYHISSLYKVEFKEQVVTNLYTEEVITSDEAKMLSDYKASLDLIYSKYKNLKYYDNSVIIKDNKLISKTNINYKKIDISKFKSLDKNNRKLLTNNKLKLKTIKKIYKDKGARCTYK